MAGQPGLQQYSQQMMQHGTQAAPNYQQSPSSMSTSTGISSSMMAQHAASQPNPAMRMNPNVSPSKEPNSILMCKCGQEHIQDIVQKVSEIFKLMQTKALPLPNGNLTPSPFADRQAKLEEHLATLTQGFKNVKLLYDKVNEMSHGLEDGQGEANIPVVGELREEKFPSPSLSSQYRTKIVTEENKEVVQQLQAKNKLLKDVIDQMRTIMWEINTMLVMKKS